MSFNPEKFLKSLTSRPGIYCMKNSEGKIIYVGKAISLNDRLKFYFSDPKDVTPKVSELISKIDDFDYIVTDSEQEALLLENQLILHCKQVLSLLMPWCQLVEGKEN